jgi:gas vesicle protein
MVYERTGDYQPSDRSTVGTALTFLLIGMGVGALTALLLAPKSGKQMRRALRRRYEDTVDALNERTEEWMERGSEVANSARDKVNAARDRVSNLRAAMK